MATKSKPRKSSKQTKTAKAPKAPKAKKEKPAADPKPVVAGECPRGGKHEWDNENGERFCTKCKEPAPPKGAKKKRAAKPAAEVITEAGDSLAPVEPVEKKKRAPKAAKPAKEKRLSALDAAAQVLAAAKAPMTSKQMIDEMVAQSLWSSPNGKTPQATLYAAIIREIAAKGPAARFKKSDRGLFVAP